MVIWIVFTVVDSDVDVHSHCTSISDRATCRCTPVAICSMPAYDLERERVLPAELMLPSYICSSASTAQPLR
jgi:hypothetical protein